MFCPQCGTSQSDELKFCKQCGANLQAVRQVATMRDASGKINWNKTWVAEMFMSQAERVRREQELELMRGLTPAVKRLREIKAGVIISSIGVGLMIFLSVLMEGIALGGKVPHDTASILTSLWVVGVLPFLVGLGLIFNGLFIGKKLVALAEQEARASAKNAGALAAAHATPPQLQSADTTEFVPASFSVTEDTTKHLNSSR